MFCLIGRFPRSGPISSSLRGHFRLSWKATQERRCRLLFKIIGLGGIGSHLAPALCRYLDALGGEDHLVVFIDGDAYEAKNATRQVFDDIGNKAEMSMAR